MTPLPSPGASVLLVSEDAGRSRAYAAALTSAGYRVLIERKATDALKRMKLKPHDAVLVMSGGLLGPPSSIDLCNALRERDAVPILVMFQEGTGEDVRLRAFDSGVDDCVAASCGPRETAARVGAVLRRARWAPVHGERTLEVGRLCLDFRGLEARFDGRVVPLTRYELDLLKALAERAGRVLTREELMERVKGAVDESFDRSVDVHICRLRAKLGDSRRRPCLLKTVRGVGYLLDPA